MISYASIDNLKFKTSMFEGVLDGGDDMVFINEEMFKKFMDDIDSVIRETPEPAPMFEYVDEEATEEPTEEPSPEATQQLIDNIVEVNPETGETNLKIPVSSKDTVTNALQLFSKLFS